LELAGEWATSDAAIAQGFAGIVAEKRRCRPLMAFGPINLGNGRERHITSISPGWEAAALNTEEHAAMQLVGGIEMLIVLGTVVWIFLRPKRCPPAHPLTARSGFAGGHFPKRHF
jgi:hypothetical protein